MSFKGIVKSALREYVAKRDTVDSLIDRIETFSKQGKIAFYPCSRFANLVIEEIQKRRPELSDSILGCFDRSKNAKSGAGASVYLLNELDRFKDQIGALVICSNTYYAREFSQIQQETSYRGEVLRSSFFDISLGHSFAAKGDASKEGAKILEAFDEVDGLLADEKSKYVFYVTWLSRILNEEGLTSLFETEDSFDYKEVTQNYQGQYQITGLDDCSARELHADLYEMKHVAPQAGDVVLDIGAFKGDTATFFAHRVSSSGRVHAFEPTQSSFEILSQNIRQNGLESIVEANNLGVYEKSGTMNAVGLATGTPWSYLTFEGGVEEVTVTSVDDFVRERGLDRVNFIKMDVEGLEENVIAGAHQTIKRFRPKLAIPLYHNTSDFLRLPLQLKKYEGYDFYMRCKMEGAFGLNIYGCPSSKGSAR